MISKAENFSFVDPTVWEKKEKKLKEKNDDIILIAFKSSAQPHPRKSRMFRKCKIDLQWHFHRKIPLATLVCVMGGHLIHLVQMFVQVY